MKSFKKMNFTICNQIFLGLIEKNGRVPLRFTTINKHIKKIFLGGIYVGFRGRVGCWPIKYSKVQKHTRVHASFLTRIYQFQKYFYKMYVYGGVRFKSPPPLLRANLEKSFFYFFKIPLLRWSFKKHLKYPPPVKS